MINVAVLDQRKYPCRTPDGCLSAEATASVEERLPCDDCRGHYPGQWSHRERGLYRLVAVRDAVVTRIDQWLFGKLQEFAPADYCPGC